MADDQQNPFTMMGMMNLMKPNPYEAALYKNKPLSLQGFRGVATDAGGNPIKSFTDAQTAHDAWDTAHPAAPSQGTTLNSVGAGLEPAGSPARAMQNAGYGDWALLDPTLAASRQGAMGGEGSVAATSGWNPANPMSATGAAAGGAAGMGGTTGTAAGAAGGTAQTNPVDMRQAYLDALANPGPVTTPGAAIPASQPVGSPSVMDSFLAANKGGGAAGGYSNHGFFDTLNKLRSA